jgi:hypothetical protein
LAAPGSTTTLPTVATSPRLAAEALDGEHDLGRGGERVATAVHRQGPGVPASPRTATFARVWPTIADTTPTEVPRARAPALLDVQLQVCRELRVATRLAARGPRLLPLVPRPRV